MLKDVVDVKPLDGYRLYLRFEDGAQGEVDVAKLIAFTGVFAALRDKAIFDQVRVDPALGTVVWPDGGDLDPDVLYAQATGEPLPPDISTGPLATSAALQRHTFRATGITVYLQGGGLLEHAQRIAAHESIRTTKLYDRTGDTVSLDEIEKIQI